MDDNIFTLDASDHLKNIKKLKEEFELNFPHEVLKNHEYGDEFALIMIFFKDTAIDIVKNVIFICETATKPFNPMTICPLSRTLFELLVTVRFIKNNPEPRILDFVQYYPIIQRKRFEKIKKYKDTDKKEWKRVINKILENHKNDFDKTEKEFEKNKQRFKLKNESLARSWSKKNIREMAQEVGLVLEYDVIYSDFSDMIHLNIYALANQVDFLNKRYYLESDLYDRARVTLYTQLIFKELFDFYRDAYKIQT